MGHELMSEDRDDLIRIAVRLWSRIREIGERKVMLEDELRRVEEKIHQKTPKESVRE